MKSYSDFKTSVVQTKRTNMEHLQKMKPLEFIDLIKSFKRAGGKISGVEVRVKVDGLGARFGKDANGQFFFESSRSGPIFDSGSFKKFTAAKTTDVISLERADHYDTLFDLLKTSTFVKAMPSDTKVMCEILYNPMANIEKDGITFVTIKYDKSKLGTTMTIVPYSVLDSQGLPHKESDTIISDLLNASTPEIKIMSNRVNDADIDISGHLQILDVLDAESLRVLKSLKRDDQPLKKLVLDLIQTAKEKIADYVLNHPTILDKDKFGEEIEGLVLGFKDRTLKVTTDKFKASKQK
jgi:hypothetical protein